MAYITSQTPVQIQPRVYSDPLEQEVRETLDYLNQLSALLINKRKNVSGEPKSDTYGPTQHVFGPSKTQSPTPTSVPGRTRTSKKTVFEKYGMDDDLELTTFQQFGFFDDDNDYKVGPKQTRSAPGLTSAYQQMNYLNGWTNPKIDAQGNAYCDCEEHYTNGLLETVLELGKQIEDYYRFRMNAAPPVSVQYSLDTKLSLEQQKKVVNEDIIPALIGKAVEIARPLAYIGK